MRLEATRSICGERKLERSTVKWKRLTTVPAVGRLRQRQDHECDRYEKWGGDESGTSPRRERARCSGSAAAGDERLVILSFDGDGRLTAGLAECTPELIAKPSGAAIR